MRLIWRISHALFSSKNTTTSKWNRRPDVRKESSQALFSFFVLLRIGHVPWTIKCHDTSCFSLKFIQTTLNDHRCRATQFSTQPWHWDCEESCMCTWTQKTDVRIPVRVSNVHIFASLFAFKRSHSPQNVSAVAQRAWWSEFSQLQTKACVPLPKVGEVPTIHWRHLGEREFRRWGNLVG